MINTSPRKHSMTGRELFKRLAPLIGVASFLLRLVPRRMVASCWWMFAFVPGKLGIGLRYLLAKRLCHSCGRNVLIGVGVTVHYWDRLTIGDNVTVHQYCYLDANGGISIGDQVSIAHASSLVAFEHTWDDLSKPIKYNPLVPGRIEIQSDVWIGCGARVLSGALIGTRTVIAAGAVVTRGNYGQGVYGGVPARLLKSLSLPASGDTDLSLECVSTEPVHAA